MLFVPILKGWLKNRWTEYGLVCTPFDAVSMLVPNMSTILKNNNCEIFMIIFMQLMVLSFYICAAA